MATKKSPKKGPKKEVLSTPFVNSTEKQCNHIWRELDDEYAAKCKEKVNVLDTCTECVIKNPNWVKVNSMFDANLLNTGYNGAGGIIPSGAGTDLHWEAGVGDASGISSVSSWIPAFVRRNSAWVASPFNNANWISVFNDAKHSSNEIVYFRIRFYLNSSINPNTFVLNMNFFADNAVNDIYVNGTSQAANYPSLLPQEQGSSTGAYGFKGFAAGNGVKISLDRNWQECENEIVVRVHSGPRYVGFLAQNTSECQEADVPAYRPTVKIGWGESECDCIESDDLETMCLTVCNNYSNIGFKGFTIGKIEVCDERGKPVGNLPNGQPSVQLIPKGPFCFGDIPPCSCVSREFALLNRGAKNGKYKIKVSGICYEVCLNYGIEQCFEFEICKD